MDFSIKKKDMNTHNKQRYEQKTLDVAYTFSAHAVKEFGSLLKCVVLFGSHARRNNQHTDATKQSDIDILIVLDDVQVQWTPEMAETYKIIAARLVEQISKDIHITTLKMTTLWEYVRNADPVGINILRDGVALMDTGLFSPLQILLKEGRIRPTPESIWGYLTKADMTLHNSRWHMMSAVVDCYWAAIDACHAALMRVECVPPTPEHVADLLEQRLVKTGRLPQKHAKTMAVMYNLYKAITHRQIDDISAHQYERHYHDVQQLVNDVRIFIQSPLTKK